MLYTELAPKLAATASVAKGRGFFANALSHLNPNRSALALQVQFKYSRLEIYKRDAVSI